jgi:hypothetical protein
MVSSFIVKIEPLTANSPSILDRGTDVAFCVTVVFNGCITNTLTGVLAENETYQNKFYLVEEEGLQQFDEIVDALMLHYQE